jgi:hypothetical protein
MKLKKLRKIRRQTTRMHQPRSRRGKTRKNKTKRKSPKTREKLARKKMIRETSPLAKRKIKISLTRVRKWMNRSRKNTKSSANASMNFEPVSSKKNSSSETSEASLKEKKSKCSFNRSTRFLPSYSKQISSRSTQPGSW